MQYACMPLVKYIPDGKPDWTKTICPECGRECWMLPIISEAKKNYPDLKEVCSECALRLS